MPFSEQDKNTPAPVGAAVPLKVGGEQYSVRIWEPGKPLYTAEQEPWIAIDTETEPLVNGQAIKPVLLQVCYPRAGYVEMVPWPYFDEFLTKCVPHTETVEIVMHNAAFDLKVLNWRENWLYDSFRRQKVTDTGMRWLLRNLEEGSYDETWSLDHVAKRLLNIDVPKDPDIRLSYRQGQPLSMAQFKYAAGDPVVTAQIRQVMDHPYKTEFIQGMGNIALTSISDNGFLVDEELRESLHRQFSEKQDKAVEWLDLWGWRPGEKNNKKRMQEIAASLERRLDLKFPRTPKSGEIQLKEKDVTALCTAEGKEVPEVLRQYFTQLHCNNILKNFLRADLVGQDGRMHPTFHPCRKTGRTSCSRPNLQNPPRDEGIRNIYMAPSGFVLSAADYEQIELCSLAESCLFRFGCSRMADVINAGEKIHYWFGDQLMQRAGLDPAADSKLRDAFKQRAKVCNFGYPGGMSPNTFRLYAAGYGLTLSLDESKELKELWLAAFPEMKLHLKPVEDAEFTNRNVRRYCRENGLSSTIRNTIQLEAALQDKGWTDAQIWNALRKLSAYTVVTVTGRVKRNCNYCDGCNLHFQGLTADGGKIAMYMLYEHGFRMVNFVHDEIISELREDHTLQDRLRLKEQLMITGMRQVIKNVKIGVETVVSRRWYKEADPLVDADGNYLIWEPEEQAAG